MYHNNQLIPCTGDVEPSFCHKKISWIHTPRKCGTFRNSVYHNNQLINYAGDVAPSFCHKNQLISNTKEMWDLQKLIISWYITRRCGTFILSQKSADFKHQGNVGPSETHNNQLIHYTVDVAPLFVSIISWFHRPWRGPQWIKISWYYQEFIWILDISWHFSPDFKTKEI